MSAPRGIGMWVAFENAIDDGPKTADLARAIEVCKRVGATWVALRAGDGGRPDGCLSMESIRTFNAAGIDVYLWVFCYAGQGADAGEIATLKKWFATGLIKGAILDAEFDFEKDTADDAKRLIAGVRAIGFDFVAHAPPDYAGGRGEGPFAALDVVSDAIMPQIYAFEHNDSGHVYHIDRVMALYHARGFGLDKVWPILCTYRPLTRGVTKDNKPIPTPLMHDEENVVARDVVAGLDHVDALEVCPAPSLYTIDALHFIKKSVGDRVLDALEERAQRTPKGSPPEIVSQIASVAQHDPYLVDRAEAAIEEDVTPTQPQTPTSKSSQRLQAVRPEDPPKS